MQVATSLSRVWLGNWEEEAIRNRNQPDKSAPARVGGSAPSLSAVLRTARPKQWLKNLLVAAAPAAAGVLHQPSVLGRVALAFAAFSMCSSGIYFINDVRDSDADREHPVKRNRPVAAGDLSPGTALILGAALLAGSLVLAVTSSRPFAAILGGYVLLMLAYSMWLKHVAVLDVAVVAGGFIIRAVAGGLAAGVHVSEWFLIVASFGALFMVTGKRQAEALSLGAGGVAHRATLAAYSPLFVQHLLSVSAAVTMIAYCLWAFISQDATGGSPWLALSIVPFVLALLRYAMLGTQGQGGEPEEVVLADRQLQAFGLIWLFMLALGVYTA